MSKEHAETVKAMYEVPHLVQRRIEAKMIGRIYANMREVLGEDAALQIVARAIEEAAVQEGRRFAQGARPAASLRHFKSMRDLWGDAMEVEVVEDGERALRFNVVRCKYIEVYRDLGLPPELVRTLSCARDAPFARGYSDHLRFTRADTLANGASACDFCYRWVE